MPDRKLRIELELVKQAAERARQQFYAGWRQDMRDTADVESKLQEKSDKQYVQAIRRHLAAGKQLEQQIRQRAKEESDAIDRSEKAYVRAIKASLRAEKQLEDQRKRDAAVIRQLQEARAKGAQQAAAQEYKAQSDVADRMLKDAVGRQKALVSLASELKEARIKGVQDAAKAEEAHAARVGAIWKQLRDARISGEQKESSDAVKNQEQISQKILADAVGRQKALVSLVEELKEARIKGIQSAAEAEAGAQRDALRRSSANIRAVLSERTKARKEAASKEVKEDEAAIRQQLDNEKFIADSMNKAIKDRKLRALKETSDAIRKMLKEDQEAENKIIDGGWAIRAANQKVRELNERAAESDRTRKFLSDQGFKEERLRKEAEKTGGVQRTQAKKTTGVIQDQQREIMKVSEAYTTMRILAQVQQGARAAVEATTESLSNSRDHVRRMIDEMELWREKVAEILAMKGMPQTGMSTAEELGRFARAGVTPDQGVAAGLAFQENMAGMIQPRILAPGQDARSYRIDQGQSERLQEYAMGLAAANGMDQASAMLLLSTIASKAPVNKEGKIDEQKVKDQFAKNFGLMQKARGATATDMRQFAEAAQKLVGQGGATSDLNELAVMFTAQAERGPNKSRVHLDALFRGLDQLSEDKREELGIKDGMNDMEALAAMTEAIPRLAKQKGIGERRLAREFLGDQREVDAFMAHLDEGVRGGLYNRVRGEQGAMNAAAGRRQIEEYRASPRGVKASQESEAARVAASQASPYEALTAMRREAANTTNESGVLQSPEGIGEAIMTKAGQGFGLGDRAQQESERLLLRNITEGLRKFPEGRAWLGSHRPLDVFTPEPEKQEAAGLLDRLKRTATPDGAFAPKGAPRFPGRVTGAAERTGVGLGMMSVAPSARDAARLAASPSSARVAANARRYEKRGMDWNAAIVSGGGRRMDAAAIRGLRGRVGHGAPIEILTDAERSAREGRLAASRAKTAAGMAATPGTRAFAAAHAGESEFQRAAREHIAANHAYLDARHAAAHPAAPDAIPSPRYPDTGFGHGQYARAATGPLFASRFRMNMVAAQTNAANAGRGDSQSFSDSTKQAIVNEKLRRMNQGLHEHDLADPSTLMYQRHAAHESSVGGIGKAARSLEKAATEMRAASRPQIPVAMNRMRN